MDLLLTRNPSVDVKQYLEATRPDQVSHRQAFEMLRRNVAFDEAFVVTSSLRGTFQIIQPQRLSEATSRSYDRDGAPVDAFTCKAVCARKTFAVSTAEAGTFGERFLTPLGVQHIAVVPLSAPLLRGYPGALHVYRTSGEPFSATEMEMLTEFASQFDELAIRTRASRRTGSESAIDSETVDGPVRIVMFNAHGSAVQMSRPSEFDETTRNRMSQLAIDRLSRETTQERVGDRLLVPDAAGDHLTFRVVVYNRHPVMEERAVGFFGQPDPAEFASLRPTDVAADPELARLIPALKFMYTEFRKSPTLVDVAKAVHLSPFHFHRRFTELLGMTPKHYLLDCQIADAKRQLLLGEKDLATIASEGGFAHQSHFTSRFKQATGQTPTRWRRMALQRQQG